MESTLLQGLHNKQGCLKPLKLHTPCTAHLLALTKDLPNVQMKQKKAKAFASLNSDTAKLIVKNINKRNSYTNGS